MNKKLDEHIERMINDPDAVRAEMEQRMIEEHGQEWYDENKQFLDAQWEATCFQLGFEPTKKKEGGE